MQPDPSKYAEEWVVYAEKDLGRVSSMLAVGDAGAAGFFLQQMTEKYLKAALIKKGWRLEKTHDLARLLLMLDERLPGLAKYEAICRDVSGYYILDRYPVSTNREVSTEEIASALAQISDLITALRAQFPASPHGEA
jgi:HEPN domain-containing protein